MKIKATETYFVFLIKACQTLDNLLRPKRRANYVIEEVIETYSLEAFEKISIDFIREVQNNLLQYESARMVRDSLLCFYGPYDEELEYDFSSDQIHQSNYETSFLLGLYANITKSNQELAKLMAYVSDFDISNYYFKEDRNYPFLDKMRGGEIKYYFSSRCKINPEPELRIPEKDVRFDFEQFKKEVEQIVDLHDREEMITKRLDELKIWTNTYDVHINNKDHYTCLYYPNFYANCKILLSGIQQSLDLQIKKAKFEKLKAAPLPSAPRQKLLWNASSKDFVETFHKLIENKKISLNGNYDLAPIVRLLYDAFDIPNDKKKTGFIKEDTLQTYFRKEHTGEPY